MCELTGTLLSVSTDFEGGITATLKVNEKGVLQRQYTELKACDKLSITLKKYRKKRSLDANAYMWVLLKKLADVLNNDKDELYKSYIERYGTFTHIVVKEQAVNKFCENWRVVRNLGEVMVNESVGVQLQCYFGSSTYDSKEMSTLINAIVEDCKEMNIETKTPQELAAICEEWGK